VILILPKNGTELAKEILITLLATDPQNVQTLKPGTLQVKVVIPEIGNPAGVFRFGSDMNSSYVIQVQGFYSSILDFKCTWMSLWLSAPKVRYSKVNIVEFWQKKVKKIIATCLSQ